MSELESLEKLRKWLNYKINRYDAMSNAILLNTGADPDELYEIADAIQAEVDERFIALPVDMYREPVKIGDVLHEHEDGHEFRVDGLKIWGDTSEWWAYQENVIQANVWFCSHVKPRTLEDVLREFDQETAAMDKYDAFHQDRPIDYKAEYDALVAKYADEIRELLGADA